MQDKKKKTKTIKVPDLKPTKDAKGGVVADVNSRNVSSSRSVNSSRNVNSGHSQNLHI